MLFLLLCISYCFLSSTAFGQVPVPTAVSGNVKDFNGLAYSYARVSASLSGCAPSGCTIIVGGVPVQVQGQQNANADVNGNFTMNLFCNTAGGGCSVISPSGTTWTITVNEIGMFPPIGTGPQTCSAQLTITGASQSVSSSFSSCPALSNVVSGTGVPSGSAGQAQFFDPLGTLSFKGSPCLNEPNVGGPLNEDCDTHFIGPNPYIDVTRQGARAIQMPFSPGIPGITATINATSNSAAISSNSCASQANGVCFINGDGVVIRNAGTAISLATPTGVTVVPSVALTGTGTGLVSTTTPTGATNYQYQVVAVTKNGGYTAASTAATTSTGAASLGSVFVNISSISRTNDVATVTTSTSHGFAVGCNANTCGEVYIAGVTSNNGDATFNGWWTVASAADSTHFTFSGAYDTRSGSASSGTGGTAGFFNCNLIQWTHVTGTWVYLVYGRTSGSMSLIGASWPQTDSNPALFFEDYGSTMEGNMTFPPYWPSTPPGSATANDFVTTITGIVGTTLTLTASATTSVTNSTIELDNEPAFLAAATAAATGSNGNTQSGAVFIPGNSLGGNSFFPINSYLNLGALTNAVSVVQSGQVWLNDTIERKQGDKWSGNRPFPQHGSVPQFAPEGGAVITVGYSRQPGFYFGTNNLASTLTEGIAMNGNVSNGALLFYAEGQFNFHITNSSFGSSTSSNDYMGIDLFFHGQPGAQSAAFGRFDIVGIFGGSPPSGGGGDGTTHTPLFYCNDCGQTKMNQIFADHRGWIFRGDPSGGSSLSVDMMYMQGAVTPMITTTQLFNGYTYLCNITGDSIPHPSYVSLSDGQSNAQGALFGCGNNALNYAAGGTNVGVSGLRVPTFLGTPSAVAGSNLPTESSHGMLNGMVQDGTVGQDFLAVLNQNQNWIGIGPNYSLFTEAQQSTPTCPVTSGGSLTTGTFNLFVMPVWPNGSEGGVSSLCQAVVTTGNQTVTVNWTPLPGVKSYRIYAAPPNNGPVFCSGATGTQTSVVFSSGNLGSCGGQSMSQMPSGGPSGANQQSIWSPKIISTGTEVTQTQCFSSAAPAVCGISIDGFVAIAAGSSSVVVDTTNVTANSEISLTFDTTQGTNLSVTCNTTPQQPYVSARTPGTSFTISVPSTFSTNPGCIGFHLKN